MKVYLDLIYSIFRKKPTEASTLSQSSPFDWMEPNFYQILNESCLVSYAEYIGPENLRQNHDPNVVVYRKQDGTYIYTYGHADNSASLRSLKNSIKNNKNYKHKLFLFNLWK